MEALFGIRLMAFASIYSAAEFGCTEWWTMLDCIGCGSEFALVSRSHTPGIGGLDQGRRMPESASLRADSFPVRRRAFSHSIQSFSHSIQLLFTYLFMGREGVLGEAQLGVGRLCGGGSNVDPEPGDDTA